MSLQASSSVALGCRDLRAEVGRHSVLKGVDLDLSPGTVVGVLGPSGAGKSTLFQTLVGERPCSFGQVSLLGEVVTRLPLFARARRRMSYVPQTPSVLWDLTVRDNLRTFFRIAKKPTDGVPAHAKKLGLEQRLDVPARGLSGGERRRLELLRAIVSGPKVLVCDEPLTGLDPAGIKEVGALFRNLSAGGTLVVFADHRIADVMPFCDQAVLLVDGQILHRGEASEFADHPAVRARYLT